MPGANIIRPSLAQAIEDAILLGNIGEIDVVLDLIEDEDEFPQPLRSGLEALRHFRANYGSHGAFPPKSDMDKKKMTLMETAWGAELLDMLRHGGEQLEQRA